MTGQYQRPGQSGAAPRAGRSARSPVLQAAGREARSASDAAGSLSDDDVGDGLTLRNGRLHLAPARDPGELKLGSKLSDAQRIDALLAHINLLRRELADAKLLGR